MAETCPSCKGVMIGPMAVESVAGSTGGELQLRVKPTSGLVKKPTRAEVQGLLCTKCGHVELRADPSEIAAKWADGAR